MGRWREIKREREIKVRNRQAENIKDRQRLFKTNTTL